MLHHPATCLYLQIILLSIKQPYQVAQVDCLSFLLSYIYAVCMSWCSWHGVHAEVRKQLLGSQFYPFPFTWIPGIQLRFLDSQKKDICAYQILGFIDAFSNKIYVTILPLFKTFAILGPIPHPLRPIFLSALCHMCSIALPCLFKTSFLYVIVSFLVCDIKPYS